MPNRTKHTPGPWKVEKSSDGELWIEGYGKDKCLWGVLEGPWKEIQDHVMPFTEREANAQLIAAAPDLLEELIRLRDWLQSIQTFNLRNGQGNRIDHDKALLSIVEVIKKAKGES